MSQKRAKKLRKRLRAEQSANALVCVEKNVPELPKRLLMRRKDPMPNGAPNSYRGGAILHPMSERAVYQFAKKRGVV